MTKQQLTESRSSHNMWENTSIISWKNPLKIMNYPQKQLTSICPLVDAIFNEQHDWQGICRGKGHHQVDNGSCVLPSLRNHRTRNSIQLENCSVCLVSNTREGKQVLSRGIFNKSGFKLYTLIAKESRHLLFK